MSRRRWSLGIGIALVGTLVWTPAAWSSDPVAPAEGASGAALLDDGDFLVAPMGAGPIVSTVPMGTNGKGLPVPLPELVDPEPETPSLLLDGDQQTIDPESVLRMPAREIRPVIAPES